MAADTASMADSLIVTVKQYAPELAALVILERTNWPVRVQALLETSCGDPGLRSDLRDMFEQTALRLLAGGDYEVAEAQALAFGQVLFRLLELGIEAKAA